MKQTSTTCIVAEIGQLERRRLAQDLHDEIGHNLTVLKLYLELMARDYKKGRTKDVIEKLEEATELVSHSITAVRRLVLDLGPAVLDQMGLLASFRVYAAQFTARTGIKVQILGKDILDLPRPSANALFRVFQGALSNIAKHSKAKRVKVTAKAVKRSGVRMTIEDDGIGFVWAKLRPKDMFGLTAMHERIERVGGQFSVTSRRSTSTDRRSGTRIDVEIPMNANESRSLKKAGYAFKDKTPHLR
jgi:two-component system sensor histidine kinase UhpB